MVIFIIFLLTNSFYSSVPDLLPLDSPPQVPRAKVPENLTPGKRRKFLAKQIEVLESAFDIDEYPSRQRYEGLAISLGVEVKKVQVFISSDVYMHQTFR